MDPDLRTDLDAVRSGKREAQGAAFQRLIRTTAEPVPWAYEVWDELVALLADPNNRTRAIAAQLLCNLAKSDPDGRILEDLDALLEVTRDERFVTARHCMQSLWKVGVVGDPARERLVAGLETRFREAAAEKNGTLVRYDILECLRKVHDAGGASVAGAVNADGTAGDGADASLRDTALAWIETEEDPKYRKKYLRLWRTA